MGNEKKKILFTYLHNNLFVKQDRRILEKQYGICNFQFKNSNSLFGLFISLCRQLFFLLKKTFTYDAHYIWFSEYHAFLPVLIGRIINKPTFLVLGGYDLAHDRLTGYGVFTGKIRSFMAFYAIRKAHHLHTVSEYMARKAAYISKRNDIKIIYNCIGLEGLLNKHKRKECILTVGSVDNYMRYKIKGIDKFIDLAICLPEFDFIFIGASRDNIKKWHGNSLPPNMMVLDKLNHSDLIEYYNSARIYCQLSRTESFGMSVAEAMYFGCVPLVTKTGALPEVVDCYGVFSKGSSIETSVLVRELAKSNQLDKPEAIREFIVQNYHEQKRERLLLQVLKETI